MSVTTRARIMRVQPTHLHHAIRHRASPVSYPHIPLLLAFSLGSAHKYSHVASPRPLYSSHALQTQFRSASTSSAAQLKTSDDNNNNNNNNSPNLTASADADLGKPPPPSQQKQSIPDPLNPPASTRPPPLDLPVREPDTKLITHLFKLGKAYTSFYKTGLKAVFTNRRLLRDLPDTPPPGLPSSSLSPSTSTSAPNLSTTSPNAITTLSPSPNKTLNPTRASLLLRARVRHDLARLPLFALIVLVCGEFTPLIVLLFPRLTPYTCRIPAQAAVIRRAVEARRAASFRALAHIARDPAALARAADGHICRALGVGSPLWDRAGLDVPWARARAAELVRRIAVDDAMLRDGGGVAALVDDEVVLACDERGISTMSLDVGTLRKKLESWVQRSAPSQTSDGEAALKEAMEKVRGLLLGLEGPI